MEIVKIPSDLDYATVEHLSTEGKERLSVIKPHTLGQASRISGVSPSDITILSFYLNTKNN